MAGRLNLSVLRRSIGEAPLITLPTPPVPLPPIGTPLPKLGVVTAPGKLAFTLNGVSRWVIDVRRFAGTPTLTTKTDAQGVSHIVLAGARLPGTLLPADFTLTVGK